MSILQSAQIVIGSIISLGILLAGAGYAYGQFYRGRDEKTKEDFSLFNTRLDGLQKICNEQEKEIQQHKKDIFDLNKEIGRLQGENTEKEKKVKELTDILANRDPALADFIKWNMENSKMFKPVFEQMIKDIADIKSLLGNKRA